MRSTNSHPLTVYLAGEIHTAWRDEVQRGSEESNLPIHYAGPVTDHSASDDCGAEILGPEDSKFWLDHKGAGINAIRARPLLAKADVVVVKFGEQYRQWNAAFDAGYAAALGKPIVIVHPPDFDHALKEIDAAACAVARDVGQVVRIMRYVSEGKL